MCPVDIQIRKCSSLSKPHCVPWDSLSPKCAYNYRLVRHGDDTTTLEPSPTDKRAHGDQAQLTLWLWETPWREGYPGKIHAWRSLSAAVVSSAGWLCCRALPWQPWCAAWGADAERSSGHPLQHNATQTQQRGGPSWQTSQARPRSTDLSRQFPGWIGIKRRRRRSCASFHSLLRLLFLPV